jgi:hypothetical protein
MKEIEAGLLDAMLTEATAGARALDNPSLASDKELEANGRSALGFLASAAEVGVATDTEPCVYTCGTCKG